MCIRDSLLEGDQATRQLQQGEVVLGFLRPADEQGAVAVQPGVAGFDDPAPGAPAGGPELELDLLAAAADVRCEPVPGEQLATLGVVDSRHRGRGPAGAALSAR